MLFLLEEMCMRNKWLRKPLIWVVVVMLLVVLSVEAGTDYSITHSLIAAGGSQAAGGGYQLTTALGQGSIGKSEAGNYELATGFLVENRDLIFIDEFEANE